jgi:hypothetical protein
LKLLELTSQATTKRLDTWRPFAIEQPQLRAEKTIKRRIRHWFALALVGLGLLAALTLNLTSTPRLWRDEGWTLLVARNWVERGYYGQINGGQLQSPGLSAAFPFVAAVALSFQLLGVGVWQGRIVAVVFTLGTLSLLYLFAGRLYNRRVAWGTLFVAVLMAPHLATNPIYIGRQVMAELPMLFYILGGYICLFLALRQPVWLAAVGVVWGLGLSAKAQPLPFWLVSLLIPSGLLLVKKQWRFAGLLLVCLLAGYYFSRGVTLFQAYLLRGHTLPGVRLAGLVDAVALTSARSARQAALSVTLLSGLPTIIALIHVARSSFSSLVRIKEAEIEDIVEISLWVLTASWLAWFLLLSAGWARHFLPVVLLGSPLVARLLYELTHGYSLSYTVDTAGSALRHLRFNRRALGALGAILLVSVYVYFTLGQWYLAYFVYPSTAVYQVAGYLNTRTPPDALIESFESEILFLLDRPYHFPPDQKDVDLIRIGLGEIQSVDYDPMPVDPDYIVVGPFAEYGHIYDPEVQSGLFRLVFQRDSYRVYAHLR